MKARGDLPFGDTRDFEEQKKGLIAPMQDLNQLVHNLGSEEILPLVMQLLTPGHDFLRAAHHLAVERCRIAWRTWYRYPPDPWDPLKDAPERCEQVRCGGDQRGVGVRIDHGRNGKPLANMLLEQLPRSANDLGFCVTTTETPRELATPSSVPQ
jgi:hypothetical protein